MKHIKDLTANDILEIIKNNGMSVLVPYNGEHAVISNSINDPVFIYNGLKPMKIILQELPTLGG